MLDTIICFQLQKIEYERTNNMTQTNKFMNSNILEGMTSISAVLNSDEHNDRRIEKVWIDSEKKKSKLREIAFLNAKSKEFSFPSLPPHFTTLPLLPRAVSETMASRAAPVTTF